MPQRESAIVGRNNVRAQVTGQEELLVRLNSIAPNTIATEATLQAVLNTLQAFTEYEAKFVVDANNEVFLEVRVWNEDTSTWASAPTYYRVGENTPASPAPVAPVTYLDSATALQSIIYSEDDSHTSGDKGMFVLAVRNDLNTTMTNANGDYSPIAVNSKGAVAIHDGGGEISVDGVVELQFNDGLGPVNVNTTNPLPVTASITFPSSFQSNTYDGAGTNAITSTSTGLITALDVNVIPSATIVSLDSKVETTDGDLSLFGQNITSISFQSIGTANAKVSVNGGSTSFDVAPGTVINLAPNVTGGFYQGTSFFWDLTTNPGSSLLIIYSYI